MLALWSDPSLRPLSPKIQLRSGVRILRGPTGTLLVSGDHAAAGIGDVTPTLEAALRSIETDALTIAHLEDAVSGLGPGQERSRLHRSLGHLAEYSMLRLRFDLGSGAVVDLVPITPRYAPQALPTESGLPLIMSPLALARWRDRVLVLESVTAGARLEVDAGVGHRLVSDAVCQSIPTLDELREDTHSETRRFAALVHLAGLSEGASSAEKVGSSTWEFHDLLFHLRTGMGPSADGFGARPRDQWVLSGVTKEERGGDVVALQGAGERKGGYAGLDRVLDRRRSTREQGASPLDAGELGRFLYRAARIADEVHDRGHTWSKRPWPSGTGHALEIYPVVSACDGLDPAIYHYRPEQHALEWISPAGSLTDEILEGARVAAAAPHVPQVLLVVTARFDRVLPRYRALGYKLVMQDVGALLQTMYVVGACMGLATCAVGGMNAVPFGRAAGLEPYREGAVGAFMLGSLPEPPKQGGGA